MTLVHDNVAASRRQLESLGGLPPDGNGAPPPERFKIKTTGERDRYADEVNTFLRHGHQGDAMQRFALTTGSGGSALLPVEIGAPVAPGLANPFRRAHELYGVPVVETLKASSLILPLLDANAGSQVTEGAAGTNENDPNADASLVLRPRTYSSGTLWMSNTLLLAAGIDLAAAVTPLLEEQKERAVSASIAAAIIADAAVTQVQATASTAGLTRANLVALTRKLPRRFRQLRFVVLGLQAFEAAEDLLDTTGRPLLEFDPEDPTLRRINGTPVFQSDDFEDFGVSKTVGLCVSLLGFRIRDAAPRRVARIETIPGRPDQTGAAVYHDVAFAYAVGAVAKLKTPAA